MTRTIRGIATLCATGLALAASTSSADEFDDDDVARWGAEYLSVVKTGRALWTDGKLGTNGVACAQCHPNAANTHPETYPKYQKQLGRVISVREMIDWCVQNPLEGAAIPPNDPRMIALEAYITFERRGVALAPGKH